MKIEAEFLGAAAFEFFHPIVLTTPAVARPVKHSQKLKNCSSVSGLFIISEKDELLLVVQVHPK